MERKITEKIDFPSTDSDRILVQACLRGDEASWESLVRSHGRRIFFLCLRFTSCREEAEDLTQEIFVRIYNNLKSFRYETGKFSCWIHRLAQNLLIDYYRKRRNRRYYLGSEQMAGLHLEDRKTINPLQALEQSEISRLMSEALARLNPDLRSAVILRDLQGMSYQEVARTTGVSEGTVKSRLFRARMHLANIFSGAGRYQGFAPQIPLEASHGVHP